MAHIFIIHYLGGRECMKRRAVTRERWGNKISRDSRIKLEPYAGSDLYLVRSCFDLPDGELEWKVFPLMFAKSGVTDVVKDE
mmetsp:Transcript_53455/g.113543  ORF Transcript_53455/g.113543 Transcript_53455/m.113543 type:complete len:82 (-) Transcript_53455:180-425(-)